MSLERRADAGLRTAELGGIRIVYDPDLDGGGRTFGQDYVDYVRREFGPVERVYEWCAGPGFIGFSLLGHGLCRSLCLSDVNPDALALVRRTIEANGLEAQVSIYLSDGLRSIPDDETWDLVVGNPPHFRSEGALTWSRLKIPFLHSPAYLVKRAFRRRTRQSREHYPLLQVDRGWQLHAGFYADVGSHLAPGGAIVLQENRLGASARTFRPMIASAGLRIVDYRRCAEYPSYFFLRVER